MNQKSNIEKYKLSLCNYTDKKMFITVALYVLWHYDRLYYIEDPLYSAEN